MYQFKISICAFCITGLCLLVYADKGVAQIGIGAGLDIRSEDPSHGYGLRLEYRILNLPPLADLKVRAHGSYFSETKKRTYTVNGLSTEVFEEKSAFDVGAAFLAGVKLGPVHPYAGIGLGVDSSEFETARTVSQPNRLKGVNEENLYWNLFFGGELSVIPYIKPFFEYRFVQLINPENINIKDSERFSLGIIFRF